MILSLGFSLKSEISGKGCVYHNLPWVFNSYVLLRGGRRGELNIMVEEERRKKEGSKPAEPRHATPRNRYIFKTDLKSSQSSDSYKIDAWHPSLGTCRLVSPLPCERNPSERKTHGVTRIYARVSVQQHAYTRVVCDGRRAGYRLMMMMMLMILMMMMLMMMTLMYKPWSWPLAFHLTAIGTATWLVATLQWVRKGPAPHYNGWCWWW